ncbi:restriction endonuclease subunit S [Rahnella sp. CJA17(1/100)]|uniref:restriction endonuclease subunit S n=1 Tax=Rahnella sp. CJA17(1/100) TaxID=2508951 RepID=UPI00106F8246|nr:restriction endonuclease subunit S [Rahnella sp. CJA17(1/100)]
MSKVPAGWEVKLLGELFPKIVVGYVGNVNNYYCSSTTGVPFYRTLNIRNGFFRKNEVVYVTKEFHKANKKSQIFNQDILIARVGANLGMVCKVEGLETEANIANAIIIKATKSYNSDFYTAFLLSKEGRDQIFSGAAGGAQGVFNTKLAQKISVPVPPLPEQTKIAQILSTWDKAIATTEKLIGNSQQQKKALMQSLLTGKKRLPGFEGEWLSEELGSLGETYSGLTGKTKEDFGSGYPYISYMNVYKNTEINIDFSEKVNIGPKENQSRVSYGDIFFTTSSETPEEVGMSSVLLSHIEDTYLNSFCFGYRLFTFEKVLPEFCKFVFRGDEMRRKISKLAQGATRYNLSKKRLMLLRIVLPPLPEQQKIAAVLTAADNEIELLQKKLAFLKQEKAALMQQLLTGKRRVEIDTTEECMDA